MGVRPPAVLPGVRAAPPEEEEGRCRRRRGSQEGEPGLSPTATVAQELNVVIAQLKQIWLRRYDA